MSSTFPTSRGPSSSSTYEAPLWDVVTGRFNVRRLRLAIVERGWTPESFADEAACGRTSVYKAVRGDAVRDRTGMAILEALQRREPRLRLLE